MAFTPSKPIGPTDKPDSPMAPKGSGDTGKRDTNKSAETATCYYNGQAYSEGAHICVSGWEKMCNSSGRWEDTGQRC